MLAYKNRMPDVTLVQLKHHERQMYPDRELKCLLTLKGCMILRCVKKAISYKYPYVIANVVPYQIYTVVMMTTCANQEYNCLDMEYSVTSVVTSKKVNGLCGYDYGESPV